MNLPQAGELRDLIDIVEVSAPFSVLHVGRKVGTVAARVWAKIEPLAGTLDDINQKVRMYRQPYRVWIRRRSGLSPFHQIDWGERRLIITAPIEEFNNAWQLIHAEHRQDAAIS